MAVFERIKNVGAQAANWIKNNKEILVIVTPLVATGLTVGGRAINKACNTYQQQNMRERQCYDPKLGHYWQLSRKLSNSEWLQVEQRQQAGERLGDILSSMNILD